MHKHAKASALLCLVAAVVACAPQTPPEIVTTGPDVDAMHVLVQEWDNALMGEDAQALVALYADDPIAMPPDGPALVGKQAIRDFFEEMFDLGTVDVKNRAAEVWVSGDLAVARGIYRLTVTSEAGEVVIETTGKWMLACRRATEGGWEAVSNIWNSDVPVAAKGS